MKLIVYYNNEEYSLNTMDELLAIVFGDNYLLLDKDDKLKYRKNIASILIGTKKIEINKDFYINTDKNFILSMLANNMIYILENKESNIFTDKINKDKMMDNYLILNTFAKELIEK